MPSVNIGGLVVNEFEQVPDPPPSSAVKQAHVDYAVNRGLPRHVAEEMTKAELIRKFRPEEDKPEEDKPEGGEESSAGTSSLTSGSSKGKNGGSVPETEASRPSPAQRTESLSGTFQAELHPEPVEASSASSAGGSTHETGKPQSSPPASSEADSAARTDRKRGRPG